MLYKNINVHLTQRFKISNKSIKHTLRAKTPQKPSADIAEQFLVSFNYML